MSVERIVVGQIAGAFGVHGEVRLKSFCAEPEAIADYVPLTDAGGRVYGQIVVTGAAKGVLVARIAPITTKEEADALKGTELLAERDKLPALPDDEFYHADLIGLEVVDTGGARLGRVKAVQDQVARLDYALSFQLSNDVAFSLAQKVVDMAPDGIDHCFFTNSGSESVDTALKIALGYHRAQGDGPHVHAHAQSGRRVHAP